MFAFNWGLNLNSGMFGMMNPYMAFGMPNPYMMRFNLMQSLIGSMLNGSRGCNCQCNNRVQYSQPLMFNYQTISPSRSLAVKSFDNSNFESYMARLNTAFTNRLGKLFEQSYEQGLNTSNVGQNLYNFESTNKTNIFGQNNSVVRNTSPTKKISNTKPNNNNSNSSKIIQISDKKIASIVHSKAQKYGVDENLILAMISQESSFVNGQTSHKGAKGLMQLMPATAKELGVTDVNDPEQNIDAGVRYMKKLLDKYNGNVKLALAAYNAGMGNVRKYGGIPPFKETQNYVSKIYKNYKNGSLS